jgi:hypothetical protein
VTDLATIPATPGALGVPGPAPAIVDVTSAGLDRLRQWVAAAQHAHQLVAPLVNTPFVPDVYRPKVDPRATDDEKREAYDIAVATATAAVLQGISLDLDPLTALQNIYVIHGRPGMYAKMMVALVQSRGHEVWTEDYTGTRAVVAGRRKGSQNVERITITMDMARAAGWTKNDTYAKTPADMLWARAASRVCDRIASDVLKGIPAVEVVEDEHATAQPQRTVKRAPRAVAPAVPSERPALPGEQVAAFAAGRAGVEHETGNSATMTTVVERPAPPGPPLPGEDAPAPPAETGEQITDPQARKMAAQFRDLGLGGRSDAERAQRLRVASVLVEREVATSSDLTSREASALIERLEDLLNRPDGERQAAVAFMLADQEDPPGDDGALPLPGDDQQ